MKQTSQSLALKRTQYAQLRTKLSNQRTYLSYVRTGFSIAAIAGSFKKKYLVLFGVIMCILSSFQYYTLNNGIDEGMKENSCIHTIPYIYVPLSLILLYLQYIK